MVIAGISAVNYILVYLISVFLKKKLHPHAHQIQKTPNFGDKKPTSVADQIRTRWDGSQPQIFDDDDDDGGI